MNILISSQHVDIGDSLRGRIQKTLQESIARYLGGIPVKGEVKVTKDGNRHGNFGLYKMVVILKLEKGRGFIIRASSQDMDPYTCFDKVFAKIKAQIVHYKDRIGSHREKHDEDGVSILKHILRNDFASDAEYDPDINMLPYKEVVDENDDFTSGDIKGFNSEQMAVEDEAITEEMIKAKAKADAASVVSKAAFKADVMPLDEAIMRMNLQGTDIYFFINSKNKHLCVLFKRGDNHISWFDTQAMRESKK